MITKYHVLATFDNHPAVLDAVKDASSWQIIDDAAWVRALDPPMPPVTRVHVDATLKHLDDITLEEAKYVIRRLCDQLLEKP